MVTIRIHGTEILNPNRLESLGELIGELRENGCDAQITYRPPTGLGVPLHEAIALVISGGAAGEVTKATISTIVSRVENGALDWLKKRFRKSADEGKFERKKRVTIIYGPDGKALKRIKADSADDIEVTDEDG